MKMSTKPDKPSKSNEPKPVPSRTIPISGSALDALRQLGDASQTSIRNRQITELVTASTKTSEAFIYIRDRLMSGASVSMRNTRFNFTLALISLFQNTNTTADMITASASAAARLYCDDIKSFDNMYRERALGALAVSAALVSSDEQLLKPAARRDCFRVARVALEARAASWKLDGAAVLIIEKLVKGKGGEVLKEAIWSLCTAKPHCHHALSLALTLWRENMIDSKAFHKIYPEIEGDFKRALRSVFDDGFSLFDSAIDSRVEEEGKGQGDVETIKQQRQQHHYDDIVPNMWRYVLEYVTKWKQGMSTSPFNLKTFWTQIVQQELMSPKISSAEKKIFVVHLLPHLLKTVQNAEDFSTVFNDDLRAFLFSLQKFDDDLRRKCKLKRHRIRSEQTNVNKSKNNSNESGGNGHERWMHIAMTYVFECMAHHVQTTKKFTLPFWTWIASGVPTISVSFPATTYFEHLSLEDKSYLLNETVTAFATPKIPSNDVISGKQRLRLVHSLRMGIVKFLTTYMKNDEDLMSDVISILTLYCLFKPRDVDHNKANGKRPAELKWKHYKPTAEKKGKSLIVEGPLPTLTEELTLAEELFRFVYSRICLSHERKKHCFHTIKWGFGGTLSTNKAKKGGKKGSGNMTNNLLVPRMGEGNDAKLSIVRGFIKLYETMMTFKVDKNDKEKAAVCTSMADMTMCLAIDLMTPGKGESKPAPKNEKENEDEDVENKDENEDKDEQEDEGAGQLLEDYASLLGRLGELCESFKESGKDNDEDRMDVDDDTGIVKAEPIEKIIHILCDVCGREGITLQPVATGIMNQIGKFVDDRVVAVLFDAIDSYGSGIERLGDSIVVEEEDEKEEEEEDDDDVDDDNDDKSDEDALMDGSNSNGKAKSKKYSAKNKDDADDEDDDDNDDDDDDNDDDKQEGGEAADKINGKGSDMDEDDDGDDDDADEDAMNMDVDDEDPKVLAALDKHLSNHMKLVMAERKKKNQDRNGRSKKGGKDNGGTKREMHVLGLVEQVARLLRLSLEKKKSDEDWEKSSYQRSVLTFLDLLVRLFELALGEHGNGDIMMNIVCDIVSKQMCVLSKATIINNMASVVQAEHANELVERFFEAVHTDDTVTGIPPAHFNEVRSATVSKAAETLLLSCSKALKKGDDGTEEENNGAIYLKALPEYEKIVKRMVGIVDNNHGKNSGDENDDENNNNGSSGGKNTKIISIKWRPNVLASFMKYGGDTALKLIGVVENAFKEQNTKAESVDGERAETKNKKMKNDNGKFMNSRCRTDAAKVISMLAEHIQQSESSSKSIKQDDNDNENLVTASLSNESKQAFWNSFERIVLTQFLEQSTSTENVKNKKKNNEWSKDAVLEFARAIGIGLRLNAFNEKNTDKLKSDFAVIAMRSTPAFAGKHGRALKKALEVRLHLSEEKAGDNNDNDEDETGEEKKSGKKRKSRGQGRLGNNRRKRKGAN